MPTGSGGSILCPGCGKHYRWAMALAGKKVRCKQCNQMFRMPADAAGVATIEPTAPLPELGKTREKVVASSPEADPYELNTGDSEPATPPAPPAAAAPTPPRAEPGKCPSCGSAVKPKAVICINCGYNFKSGQKLQTQTVQEPEDEVEPPSPAPTSAPSPPTTPTPTIPASVLALGGGRSALAKAIEAGETELDSRATDVYAPIALFVIGVILLLLAAFWLGPWAQNMILEMEHQSYGAVASGGGPPPKVGIGYSVALLVYAAVRLLVQFPLMILAIFLVARLFGSSFGGLLTGLLKLAAIAVVLGGTNDCLWAGLDIITGGFGGLGWGIRNGIVFGVFWALCAWLFEMDPLEILVMYLLVMFLPILAMVFVGALIFAMFA